MKTQNRKNKTLFKHILRPMAMSVAMFASMAVNAQEARRETIDFNITEISRTGTLAMPKCSEGEA